MKTLLISGMYLGVLFAAADAARAHGGQYRGPIDVVPPAPGPRGNTGQPSGPNGPTTGRPGQPGAPTPSGPTTPTAGQPGAPSPSGPRPARTPGRGSEVVDDFTSWVYWWEFNKDPYLRLKEAVHRAPPQTGSDDFYLGFRPGDSVDLIRPTAEQIRDQILPALKRALDGTLERDFDIISSCMIALAKIGSDHPTFRLVDVFAGRLGASNQEIRETAALALGIAGIGAEPERQLDLLTGLARDDATGRKAGDGARVDRRTRAFACYGLGLLAHGTPNLAVKRRAYEALAAVLAARVDRNLDVAAIHGMSLLNLDTGPATPDRALLEEVLGTLEAFYDLPLGRGEELIQAHCPTAIAKLIGPADPAADRFRARFASDLATRDGRRRVGHDLARSCTLALGRLARPSAADGDPDAALHALLLDTSRSHRDPQTRSFAVLALGQIGGETSRVALLREFRRARLLEKTWIALALGVLAFEEREANGATAGLIGTTLLAAFRSEKNPELLGALAVALGLAGHAEAASDLRDMLRARLAQEQLAGYLCIGLALMKDKGSRELLRDVMRTSTRRPELLQQAAVALGILGDKDAALELGAMLGDSEHNLATLSAVAGALGFIGEQRTIHPLQQMLANDRLGQLSRAFAAVALGGIADKELLPWNSKLAVDTNYRANTETLTDGATGILDIL